MPLAASAQLPWDPAPPGSVATLVDVTGLVDLLGIGSRCSFRGNAKLTRVHLDRRLTALQVLPLAPSLQPKGLAVIVAAGLPGGTKVSDKPANPGQAIANPQ